jgi:hypothetical protein
LAERTYFFQVASVLCAPAARVDAAEWQRAAVLLYEVTKASALDISYVAVGHRKGSEGLPLWMDAYGAPGTALAAMLAKDPSEWGRGDAVTAALSCAANLTAIGAGITAVCATAGLAEMEWIVGWMTACPYANAHPQPADRYARL